MFFFRKPKYTVEKIPIIKELLFINYHSEFRYIQKWEDLLRIDPEEIERKVRAELFGLTTIEQYKDYVGDSVFFRPKYKNEYKCIW